MQKDRYVIKDINSKYPLNINRFVLILIIILYLFSTINSNGFYHPDEHFQLIEFAGLKAGWNTSDDLAWEYGAQIRPTLQPYLALGIFKLAGLFGGQRPFYTGNPVKRANCGFFHPLCFIFHKLLQTFYKKQVSSGIDCFVVLYMVFSLHQCAVLIGNMVGVMLVDICRSYRIKQTK